MHQRATILLICWMAACSNDGVSTPTGANDPPSTTDDDGSTGAVDETTHASPADTSTGSDEPDDSGGLVLDVAPGGGGDTEDVACPCVGTGEGIYLITDDSQMWTFDPDSLELEHLGAIACPTEGEFQSMAIDRPGRAVLSYLSWSPVPTITIETFSLDLNDLSSCEPIDLGVPDDRLLGGMGYASASATNTCDDLYVFGLSATDDTVGTGVLARIDAEDGWVQLGNVAYEQTQLTGTADGRLFGFAGDTKQASLVGFDKDDADVVEAHMLPDLNAVNGLGFAFWGGDVWFFTDSPEHEKSRVTRLDHDLSDGGGTTVVVDETPVRFLGAGVSTCVPLTPEG
jgi:hypothetical protein